MDKRVDKRMMEVRLCRAAEIFADVHWQALFAGYERECANPEMGASWPSLDMYENIEAAGLGQCFAAREDGLLYGFAFVIVGGLPHYARKCATVESLYVARETRGGGLGTALMHAVGDYAKEQGCHAIFISAPAQSRLARLLFLSEDQYRNTNHIFTKRLD